MIKISKDGIEIPHPRFLSDVGIGLIVIIYLIILNEILSIIDIGLFKDGLSVFAVSLSILMILSIPIAGIIVNVFSWFLLEHVQMRFCYWIWKRTLFISSMLGSEAYSKKLLSKLQTRETHLDAQKIQISMRSSAVEIGHIDIQRSIRILFRSLSLLAFLNAFFFSLHCSVFYWSIACASVFLMLGGALAFFTDWQLLLMEEFKDTITIKDVE